MQKVLMACWLPMERRELPSHPRLPSIWFHPLLWQHLKTQYQAAFLETNRKAWLIATETQFSMFTVRVSSSFIHLRGLCVCVCTDTMCVSGEGVVQVSLVLEREFLFNSEYPHLPTAAAFCLYLFKALPVTAPGTTATLISWRQTPRYLHWLISTHKHQGC